MNRLTAPKYLVLVMALATQAAMAAWQAEDLFPAEGDPFVGNYKGRWSEREDVNPDIAAQVVALGQDRYQIRLVTKLFMRCPPLLIVEAEKAGDTVSFKASGHYGTIEGNSFTGGRRAGRVTFEMKKAAHTAPNVGRTPPDGAIVLFDGSGFDQWQDSEGWELIEGGVAMVTPSGGDLLSKRQFKDAQLHVEFRTPFMPRAKGQQRANSGVFLQDTYEVQILDSFGLDGYYNECGALYKVSAPRVNACAPPLEWQAYDISYRAPRFGSDGKVTEHPRMTVYHNGILIQKDQDMAWITGWKEKDRLAPPPTEPGSIRLQAHHNFVQFRNIWIIDVEGK